MVLDNAFEDVDAALSWHPYHYWDITTSGRAIINAYFGFRGVSAHSLHAEQGRDAMDALELMIQGYNLMRKHVQENTMLSCSIICSGSKAANVVSDYAQGLFQLRHPDQHYLNELFSRVLDLAKGAALMTGTKLEEPMLAGSYANYLVNDVLNAVQKNNMQQVLPLSYSEEEIRLGKDFLAVGTNPNAPKPYRSDINTGQELIHSDLCDVSWQLPLSHFFGVTLAEGTKPHNWGTVAQGKGSAAKKGMHAAAEIMSNSALDLIENPTLLAQAKAEYQNKIRSRKSYVTLMRKDDLKRFINS